MEINEQDEGQPLMKDLVLLLCWLYRGCADACFEHVVVAAAQLVHSVAAGPEQVAQLAWHGTQVSAAVDEPPEHV